MAEAMMEEMGKAEHAEEAVAVTEEAVEEEC